MTIITSYLLSLSLSPYGVFSLLKLFLLFAGFGGMKKQTERERGREREKGEFRRTDPYSFQGLEIRLFRFSFFSLRKTQFPLFDFGV